MKKKKSQLTPHVQEQCGVWLSAKGRDKLQEGSNNQRRLPSSFRQPRVVLTDVIIQQHKIRIGGKQSNLNKFFKCSDKPANQGHPSVAKRTKLNPSVIQTTLDGLPGGRSSKQEKENQSPVPRNLGGGNIEEFEGDQQHLRLISGGSDGCSQEGNSSNGVPLTRLKRKGNFEEVPVKKSHLDTCRHGSEPPSELSQPAILGAAPKHESLGISIRHRSCSLLDSSLLCRGENDTRVLLDGTNTWRGGRLELCQEDKVQMPRCSVDGNEHSSAATGDEGVHHLADGQRRGIRHGMEPCLRQTEQLLRHMSDAEGYSSLREENVGDDANSLSEFEDSTPSILRDSLVGLDSAMGCGTPTQGLGRAGSELPGRRMVVGLPASGRDGEDSYLPETPVTREEGEAHPVGGQRRRISDGMEPRLRQKKQLLRHMSDAEGYSSLREENVGDDANSLSEFEDFSPSVLRDSLVGLDSAMGCETQTQRHGRASLKLPGRRMVVGLPASGRDGEDSSLPETPVTREEGVAHPVGGKRGRISDGMGSRLSEGSQLIKNPFGGNEYSLLGAKDIGDDTNSLSEFEDFTPSILRDSLVGLDSVKISATQG